MVDRGLKTQSGQTKDYKIVICYFSAKYSALKSNSKYLLVQNQDNVSEWSNILFQWCNTKNPTKRVDLNFLCDLDHMVVGFTTTYAISA